MDRVPQVPQGRQFLRPPDEDVADFSVQRFGGVAFVTLGGSFLLLQGLAAKRGLKWAFSLCLGLSALGLLLLLVLSFPMPREVRLAVGYIAMVPALAGLVGSMIFPTAILSDIIDGAHEREPGVEQSGAYNGTFNLLLAVSGSLAMLLVTGTMSAFGPDSVGGYGVVFAVGAGLVGLAALAFRRVDVVGTDERRGKV
ncbi:MAG: hypothetical protein ACTSU5_18355 [Promethearchaeota archaeon]